MKKSKAFEFNSLKPERTQTKYEERGLVFIDDIRKIKKNPDSCPIHRHQIKAVLKTKKLLTKDADKCKEKGPVLIVAPTGSGKSGMIFMLPYVLQSRKVLVLTPSTIISEQLGATFGLENHHCFLEKLGICNDPIKLQGFLENGRIIRSSTEIIPDKLLNLVIVNAQKFGGKCKTTLSLMYRNEEIIKDVQKFFREFDTLIVDEAHHYPADTWLNIVREFHKPGNGLNKRSIFLTATPFRKDWDGSLQPILPDQRVAITITKEQLEGTTIRKSQFVEKYSLKHLYDNIKDCLKANFKAERRFKHQAMILVRTKKEAVDYARRLCRWDNNPHYAVPLVSDRPTVKKDTDNFNKGKYTVAVTCGLLKEGYDNSSVTVVVILRNVKAKVLFDQFIGRCMRKKRFEDGIPDQSMATILSYGVFNQKEMWQERNNLASRDPLEDDEDDDEDDDE